MKTLNLLLLLPFKLLKWMFTIEEGYQDQCGYHSFIDDHRYDAVSCLCGDNMKKINEQVRRYYHGDSEDETTIEQKAEEYSQTHCN